MTSRDLVYKTLEFKNPERIPRQLWKLLWADIYCSEEVKNIEQKYPTDFGYAIGGESQLPPTKGDAFEIGDYVDPWGAKFNNIHRGIIGEVKEALITGENWEDFGKAHIPYELLSIDIEYINKQCKESDKFVFASGSGIPRPFEQLQFLRGTEQLYMDLALSSHGMFAFLEKMHDFYCQWVKAWAATDVDGIIIMDDWGSQNSLLINPKTWVEVFKPLYKDYIDIAKKYGKKVFMHSDGYTLEIIPHLIDLGLDALNTQIFCIGIEKLKQFKGKVTFWGEIDRQHLLVNASAEEVKKAVYNVYDTLWTNGGCIAQCEFGAGAKPENIHAVFDAWNEVQHQE